MLGERDDRRAGGEGDRVLHGGQLAPRRGEQRDRRQARHAERDGQARARQPRHHPRGGQGADAGGRDRGDAVVGNVQQRAGGVGVGDPEPADRRVGRERGADVARHRRGPEDAHAEAAHHAPGQQRGRAELQRRHRALHDQPARRQQPDAAGGQRLRRDGQRVGRVPAGGAAQRRQRGDGAEPEHDRAAQEVRSVAHRGHDHIVPSQHAIQAAFRSSA